MIIKIKLPPRFCRDCGRPAFEQLGRCTHCIANDAVAAFFDGLGIPPRDGDR